MIPIHFIRMWNLIIIIIIIFDHSLKWRMCKQESVQENERQKNLPDLEILSDHLILARRLVLVMINMKKNLSSCRWWRPGGPQRENQRELKKMDKYFDLAKKLNKNCGTWGTNYSWCTWNVRQRIGERVEELEIRGRTKIIQTTAIAKSAGTVKHTECFFAEE